MICLLSAHPAAGYYTEPIPFDATPADLKYTLESISTVGTVYVGEYVDLLPHPLLACLLAMPHAMKSSYRNDCLRRHGPLADSMRQYLRR